MFRKRNDDLARKQHRKDSIGSKCSIQSIEWNLIGNILLIINDNDIYWMGVNRSENPMLIRLTKSGSIKQSIYNGFNDYIYREINNSLVPIRRIPIYSDVHHDDNSDEQWQNYDEDNRSSLNYRYPTINSSIGVVNLWIIEIDIDSNRFSEPIRLIAPDVVSKQEHYVLQVDWIQQNRLIVVWSDRNQQQSILGICDQQSQWRCERLAIMKNLLQIKHIPNSHLVVPSSRNSTIGSKASQNQLIYAGQFLVTDQKDLQLSPLKLYSINVDKKSIKPYHINRVEANDDIDSNGSLPSSSQIQIEELLGYNSESRLIFFTGKSLNQTNFDSLEDVPEQDIRSNLFVYSIDFGTIHCISCQLIRCYQMKQSDRSSICIDLRRSVTRNENDPNEIACILKEIHLSFLSEYAIITCLSGIIPKVYLIKFITIQNNQFTEKDRIQKFDLIDHLRIKLLTPSNFQSEGSRKYSFLFEMFPPKINHHFVPPSSRSTRPENGISVFQIDHYPDLEWAIHLVTEHNLIYAWLDGQFYQPTTKEGEMDESDSIQEISFDELIDDYSTLIEFIQTNLTFINIDQTCLIGQNVGGFFVLNSIATTSIQCGIAISPIIDWTVINSCIFEQYFDLNRIKLNGSEYRSRTMIDPKQLSHKNLLIIHGTSNELFPISQTMRLFKSLTMNEQNRFETKASWNIDPLVSSTSPSTQSPSIEYNWTVDHYHFLELYIDDGNDLSHVLEHLYRKIEFFIFQWIVIE
ncbi:origin recognition complex subunit 3 [Sarcoptes scabiei]|nr:origin recognition complex subunit 3 [Sarcoptes scabiei]